MRHHPGSPHGLGKENKAPGTGTSAVCRRLRKQRAVTATTTSGCSMQTRSGSRKPAGPPWPGCQILRDCIRPGPGPAGVWGGPRGPSRGRKGLWSPEVGWERRDGHVWSHQGLDQRMWVGRRSGAERDSDSHAVWVPSGRRAPSVT